MLQVTDQFAAMNKVQLDAALNFGELLHESIERFTELQLQTGHAALDEAMRAAKQLAGAKDFSAVASISTSFGQPAWDNATTYGKRLWQLIGTTQLELAQALEQQVAELNRTMVLALDTAATSAPAGSEAVVNAVKSAIQSANTAYESMVKATKQMASAAEANLAAATAPAVPAKRKAA